MSNTFASRVVELMEEMRAAGLSDRGIADLFRIKLNGSRPRNDSYLGAHVGRSTVIAFNQEAQKRNMPVSRLIARTLQCVSSEKLFDAVLDQQEDK